MCTKSGTTRTDLLINSKVSGCTGDCVVTAVTTSHPFAGQPSQARQRRKVSDCLVLVTVTCKYTHLQVKCYQYDKEGGLLINSKVSDCYQGLVLVNVTAVTCKYTGRQSYQYDKESSSTQ